MKETLQNYKIKTIKENINRRNFFFPIHLWNIFDVLANFTAESVELKIKVTSIQRTNKKQLAKRQVGVSKLELNMNVINLYKSGYPINEYGNRAVSEAEVLFSVY